MKRKILYLLTFILLIGFTTGCMTEENKKEDETINQNVAEEYTELELIETTIRFKKQNPTNYWDSEDDYGALEVTTVYIPSEGGKEVEDYRDAENISGIMFEYDETAIKDKTKIKDSYKRWDNLDVEIEDINKGIFTRHIKGESSKLYVESYSFAKEIEVDDEKKTLYYDVELRIYKDDYTTEEQKKLISEYHTIIDTFEIK